MLARQLIKLALIPVRGSNPAICTANPFRPVRIISRYCRRSFATMISSEAAKKKSVDAIASERPPSQDDLDTSTSSKEKFVVTEKSGNVFLIALNRPEKKNCVNEETGRQLLEAILEFEQDDSVKAGVLYGKGGTFCAGWDLTSLSGKDETWARQLPSFPGAMGPTRNFIRKPLIAAVQGYAVAGGLELALLCDMRVVEDDAVMGVFCRRYGVPLVDGGTVRLPAIVGFGRAMDLILTGRAVSGQEALDMGLANRLVARGTAVGQACTLAASIARFPYECTLADRKSAYYATFTAASYEDAIEFEHENGREIIVKEAIKGAQGFVSGLGKHGKFNFSSDTIQNNTTKVPP